MPTTWWRASSTSTRLGASLPISRTDWSASGCNSTPTRLGSSSLVVMPPRTAKPVGLKPETFDFVGFTHICGANRKGGFIIRRHTVRKRLRAKLHEIKDAMQRMMHLPIQDQGGYLKRVMNGYFNYFAVPTNNRAINSFYRHTVWYWYRSLRRRSQTSRLTWQDMRRLVG